MVAYESFHPAHVFKQTIRNLKESSLDRKLLPCPCLTAPDPGPVPSCQRRSPGLDGLGGRATWNQKGSPHRKFERKYVAGSSHYRVSGWTSLVFILLCASIASRRQESHRVFHVVLPVVVFMTSWAPYGPQWGRDFIFLLLILHL